MLMETKNLSKRSLLALLLRAALVLLICLGVAYGFAWFIIHYASRTTTTLIDYSYSLLV